jgi:hypothetical protein
MPKMRVQPKQSSRCAGSIQAANPGAMAACTVWHGSDACGNGALSPA